MSIDEVAKLIFIISISFAILMVGFQLARILGKTADILQDFRKSIRNIGNLSDQLVDDYKVVSAAVKAITDFFMHFNDNVLTPIKNVTGFVSRFVRRDKSVGEDEFENKDY